MTGGDRHAPGGVFGIRQFLPVLLGLLGLGASLGFAVSLGAVGIPLGDVWGIIFFRCGLPVEPTWTSAHEQIVWLIRLPRVLLAGLVGSGLALVGVTMQALVRNRLADPYLLGISAGSSVGAVSVLAFGVFAFAGIYAISLGAFLGAVLAMFVVLLFSRQTGVVLPHRLILSGLAVGYILTGITSLVTLTSDNRQLAGQVFAWTMGSLSRASWSELVLPLVVVLGGLAILLVLSRTLNALVMGDETAVTLGIDLKRVRFWLFLLVSLVTGVLVAVSGSIGFIGLMVPHLTRLLVGNDHRAVLPISMLVGSLVLIWVDWVARVVMAPTELPVGVITALLGGPFFLVILVRKAGGRSWT